MRCWTSDRQDNHGTRVAIITYSKCGYFEEHFKDPRQAKPVTKYDRCHE